MNKRSDEDAFGRLAPAWTVGVGDLSGRVSAAIGSASPAGADQVLAALRTMGSELAELRRSQALLFEEVVRLRADLEGRRPSRVTPYAHAEGFIRLA